MLRFRGWCFGEDTILLRVIGKGDLTSSLYVGRQASTSFCVLECCDAINALLDYSCYPCVCAVSAPPVGPLSRLHRNLVFYAVVGLWSVSTNAIQDSKGHTSRGFKDYFGGKKTPTLKSPGIKCIGRL